MGNKIGGALQNGRGGGQRFTLSPWWGGGGQRVLDFRFSYFVALLTVINDQTLEINDLLTVTCDAYFKGNTGLFSEIIKQKFHTLWSIILAFLHTKRCLLRI